MTKMNDMHSIQNGPIIVSGMTPLHQAALDGNLAAVRLLIRNGADVNRIDEDSWTPLHAACAEGHADIVKWVIKDLEWITMRL